MNLQRVNDRLFFPVIALISEAQAQALGLTPLDHERILAALPYCRGRLLDIGCGMNRLVRRYGSGVGVDVFPWPGIDVLCDSTELPFGDGTFDTVTLLACLNHIADRKRGPVLSEARRVLSEDGRLVVSMINPFVGAVVHWLRHKYDEDQRVRGMGEEERYGLWASEVRALFERSGFQVVCHTPFVFGLNQLFVGVKAGRRGNTQGVGRVPATCRGSEQSWVVVPAYNEELTVAHVVRALRERGLTHVLVVDDGSSDRTAERANESGAYVVKHAINRGLGGALGTGLAAARRLRAQAVVTVDGDGQHDPGDVLAVLAPVLQGSADVVIGSRILERRDMPWSRRLANFVANLLTGLIFGKWSSDSQSGLRAFSRAALERIDIRTNGFEVSSELIGEVTRLKLRYAEVPIHAIYTPYSLSKGQSLGNGIRTLGHLILRRYLA